MKKKNVVLYAGVLSMVMLGGCGTSTSNETSTPVTQEVTQDATEAPEVTEAPEAEKATTGNEEKNNSTEVTNEENTSEETEGKDVRSDFSECFHTVTSTAQKKDETLEYDAAYANVVNGILAAIGE